jgi:hypothetical protein
MTDQEKIDQLIENAYLWDSNRGNISPRYNPVTTATFWTRELLKNHVEILSLMATVMAGPVQNNVRGLDNVFACTKNSSCQFELSGWTNMGMDSNLEERVRQTCHERAAEIVQDFGRNNRLAHEEERFYTFHPYLLWYPILGVNQDTMAPQISFRHSDAGIMLNKY